MATKKAYTLNKEKKVITIDDNVKATRAEEKDIDRYVAAGYEIKHKSEKRAKAATKRADGLKDENIKEALKDDKKALAKYEEIKKGKGEGFGFFAAKSWDKKNFQK